MSYFEETMDNIRTYLEEAGEDWQEKAGKSTSRGFVYTMPAGDGLPPMQVNVRVDERLEYLIFEAYPGVRAVEPEYRYSLALFCQTHTPEVGSLQLEEDYGEVYFHCETTIADYACGGETLQAMENAARDGIAPVLPLLRALAKGDSLEQVPGDALCDHKNRVDGNFDAENVEAIGAYLKEDSGHNTVGVGKAQARVLFSSEILSSKNRYTLEVHRGGAFLTFWLFSGRSGICVEPAYQMRAAWLLNHNSDEKKVGAFSMGNRCGVKVNLCTAEGVISGNTVEEYKLLLAFMLNDMAQDLLRLACGRFSEGEMKRLRKFDSTWRLRSGAWDPADDAQCFNGLFSLPGLLDPDEVEVDLPDLPEEPETDYNTDPADDENPDDTDPADEADDEDRPVA